MNAERETSIVDSTWNLLRECLIWRAGTKKSRMEQVAQGAEVQMHWLAKFEGGKINNPGARTIERLNAYLDRLREEEGGWQGEPPQAAA